MQTTTKINNQSSQQFISAMSMTFVKRVVEFAEKATAKNIVIKNEITDFGDVFRSLDHYLVSKATVENVKDVLKGNDAETTSIIKSPEENCDEIAFKTSGLQAILSDIHINDDHEFTNKDYDYRAYKMKMLLSIYSEVMDNMPFSEKELKIAVDLAQSAKPIPGAPKSYCEILCKVLFIFVVLIGIIFAGTNKQ